MSELQALKMAVALYFKECEPSNYTLAVMKSEAQQLRDQADKLDSCNEAKEKLQIKAGILTKTITLEYKQ